MGLATDLQGEVDEILRLDWNTRQGQVVPESGDVTLGNEAVTFDDAVVIYADLKSSTAMVDAYPWTFAAEAYKSFLLCAARAIRSENGDITACARTSALRSTPRSTPNGSTAEIPSRAR